jgi:hypothetical protein
MNRGEPEVGSVIESRIDAFAQADQRIALGRDQRTCDICGNEWHGPDYCRQGDCRSSVFTSRTIRPTIMEITGRGLTAVKEPLEPKVDASPADLEALQELRAALVDAERCLVSADGAARRLVNVNVTNVGVFGHIQSVLNSMTTPGDFQLRADVPLTSISLVPVLRALVGEIDRTLHQYEQEKNK